MIRNNNFRGIERLGDILLVGVALFVPVMTAVWVITQYQ